MNGTRRQSGLSRAVGGIASIAVAAALLAGCGSDDDAAPSDSRSTPAVEPVAESAAGTGGVATTEGMRAVDDAFGATEIPADPQRVIADSVSTYAHLVSLGITPIAVALPEGISPDYISADAAEMTNVVAGDGWTIDLEQALAMDPDLIVGVGAEYNAENCDAYRAAVATFCFTEVWDAGTDQDIKDTINGLATALGREAEGAEAIAAYEDRVDALASRVADAGLDEKKVGIVRFDSGGFIGVRIDQTPNAILGALGFATPDFPEATVDGYLELSLENLELLDAADVLIVNTDDDVVIDEVAAMNSPLWDQLALVQNGGIVIASAWNGGDLPQLQRILDDIEAGIIEPAEGG